MTILVTGGCGFVGSNLIRLLRSELPHERLVNFDALTYAGNVENLAGIDIGERYRFIHGDVCDRALLNAVVGEECPRAILHLAAESHVDRSILAPDQFLRTNVLGTGEVLDAARRGGVGRVVISSTDEVYGSLGATGLFDECTALDPSNPYAASKAAADQLALSYHRTYGLDVVITRCSNNYGPYQFPEKMIPFMTIRALENERLPVYGDGEHVRDWVAVEDHCRGILLALDRGATGRVYNLGGMSERRNIDVVRQILEHLKKHEGLIQLVPDRPGHDRRYATNIGRAREELGFAPSATFETRLRETVDWYVAHQAWWSQARDERYSVYLAENYGARRGNAP